MILLTSRKDPVVLQAEQWKEHPSAETFLVEGYRFVREIPSQALRCIFTRCPEKHRELLEANCTVPTYQVTESIMKKISSAKSGQEIVCAVRKPPRPCPKRLVLLDGVQDPGNVGTIVRTAYAFGFGVVVSPDSADPFSQKVINSTAGAFLHCYIQREDPKKTILQQKKVGAKILGAAIDQRALPPEQMETTPPLVLVIGNEGQGISPAVLELCDQKVYIPMLRPFNSLNAATAAAILIYAFRERSKPV